jgi:hypothetical protein
MLVLAGWFILSGMVFAQPTLLSGTINLYRKVTLVNCPANQVQVSPNATGFAAGDKVMLIQMDGATVDETNTGSFGSISSIGYVGNYEIHTITSVAGNTLTFQYQIMRDYDPVTGSVQLVRIAHYADAKISSAGVTCDPYDPVAGLGGVFALMVDDTLYWEGNVNVNHMGFPGGENNYDNSNCGISNNTDYANYFYPWTTSTVNFNGAPKGYGVGRRIINKEGGRGRLANAGGGGNQHNAGGGGGGAYGKGGRGGIRAYPRSSFFGPYCKGYMSGLGAQELGPYYSNIENRVFLGGGGGAGHTANSTAGPTRGIGGAGGPIVLIKANYTQRTGSGARYINAYGQSAPTQGSDGSGGGGGGGTVLLHINNFVGTNVFHVRAYGGRGGAQSWTGAIEDCMGPGGGGGGGVIWYADAAIPPTGLATRSVIAGLSGNQTGTCSTIPLDTINRKEQAGDVGLEMAGLVLPESFVAPNGCVLPVEFLAFQGKQVYDRVRLDWSTALEKNNRVFVIERAETPELPFVEIGEVEGNGFSNVAKSYTFDDRDPMSGVAYYRLRQVDFNGGFTYSNVVAVEFRPEEKLIYRIYPNPIESGNSLTLECYLREAAAAQVVVVDQLGRMVFQAQPQMEEGRNRVEIPTGSLEGGIYFLQVTTPDFRDSKRFVVE